MREERQIKVNREAIFKFVKNRAKGCKPCKYAWAIESPDANATADTRPVENAPSPQGQKPSLPKTEPQVPAKPKPRFEYRYSTTYNLHRLPPEEAAARLKKIEEQERQ